MLLRFRPHSVVNMNEKEYWAAIATVIKMEMTANSISQAKLAELVGIGREAMNAYLAGRREIPFGTFMKVIDTLNVTPQWVFQEAERRMK